MLLFLRALFLVVLASMLNVTSWASLQCPLFAIPRDVATHPWFVATLFDAYWGFLTFFVWVAYKQIAWSARVAWCIAMLLLGNIAMAAYCLNELFHARTVAELPQILTRRHDGKSWLGLALTCLGLVVIGGALSA